MQKHPYGYALIAFGFETRSFWLQSLTVFSSALFTHHWTFIDQTTLHFPQITFVMIHFLVKFQGGGQSYAGISLGALTLGKTFSFRVSAFPSVRGGGWTGCVLSGSNTQCASIRVMETNLLSQYSLFGQRLMQVFAN